MRPRRQERHRSRGRLLGGVGAALGQALVMVKDLERELNGKSSRRTA
jgi:hypothetical protein